MADIHSAAGEVRQGQKKERRKKEEQTTA